MKIVAGCDGGGTKCLVRVAACDDNGSILKTAQGHAGPANVRSNPSLALQNIQAATNEAMHLLQLADEDGLHEDASQEKSIQTFVAALAGAGSLDVQQEWTQRLAKELNIAHVEVVPDAAVLFAAADVQGAATASVIGTGSIVWTRDEAGNVTRAGGLGPQLGDEGSAYWIGQAAIKYVVADPSTSTSLCKAVLEHFAATNMDDVIARSSKATPGMVAQLAASVFAEQNEPAGKAIIDNAAAHIAKLLIDATQGISTSQEQPLAWICAGGVAIHQAAFLQQIGSLCAEDQLFLGEPITIREPVAGALRIAMELR